MKNFFFNKQCIILILGLISVPAFSQDIPHPVNNRGIYDFLDELASGHIITINSAVRPFTRSFIAGCLREAAEKSDQLTRRQKRELGFYMADFGKETPVPQSGTPPKGGFTMQGDDGTAGRRDDGTTVRSLFAGSADEGLRRDLFYYSDSFFSITLNPVLGGEVFYNSSGEATYWRNGLEARAYAGSWGFYASLRDNHEKPLLGLPEYLTQREGGHIKLGTDWSEMQGGITYSWKWGNGGIVKDNLEWGNNYAGANIFGGDNPSFVHLRLQLYPVKWFTFNYFHGWLNSMVVDSTRSFWVTNSYGTDYREVYHRKYIAANLFTFTPVRHLNISAGNSIIYDNSTLNPAFLVPLMFYKSVDHSVSSGIDNMNSQMFFDISSRQIRNMHIFVTLFVDELSVKRIFRKDEWNFVSWKAGFRLGHFPVEDLFLTTEFTYTYPLTYQHYVPTVTYESNTFNLGHYLRDNSRQWYVAIDYRPVRALNIRLSFSDAIRGPDYTELGGSRVGNPPLESVSWHNTTTGIEASYQLINDLYITASYYHSRITGDPGWTPDYLQGVRNTVSCGVGMGF